MLWNSKYSISNNKRNDNLPGIRSLVLKHNSAFPEMKIQYVKVRSRIREITLYTYKVGNYS